jgi:alpha-beta hydrolase superfamily lysophospholipase
VARAARLMAVLVLICGLTGCDEADAPLEVVSVEVDGHGTLALSVPDEAIKAVVVYFHGADQAAPVIQTSAKHSAFFDPLLRAGYAVVTADADGNAYGNPATRQAYRDLITAAEAWYHAKATVFVAESMGALAALALLRDDSAHVVTAMVGITPLMGIPPYIRNVPFIDAPWGGQITDAADR